MLAPSELHHLWSLVHEEHRLAFVASLTQEAADRLFAYQLREHERQFAMQRAAKQADRRDLPFDNTNDSALVERRERDC